MIQSALIRELASVRQMPVQQLLDTRYERFRSMAQFYTVDQPGA